MLASVSPRKRRAEVPRQAVTPSGMRCLMQWLCTLYHHPWRQSSTCSTGEGGCREARIKRENRRRRRIALEMGHFGPPNTMHSSRSSNEAVQLSDVNRRRRTSHLHQLERVDRDHNARYLVWLPDLLLGALETATKAAQHGHPAHPARAAQPRLSGPLGAFVLRR